MGNWWDQDQQTLDRIAADTPSLLDVSAELLALAADIAPVSDELVAAAAAVTAREINDPGRVASAVLRIASAVKNGETVTIGDDVYEVDTSVAESLTDAAHIRLDLSGGATRRASGTLTSANTGAFTAGKKVTIGAKAYTFRAAITGGSVDGDVLAGANGDAGLANLIAAINLAAGSGVTYAAAMTANAARVTAGAVIAHAVIIAALDGGTAGNAIVFSTDEAKLSVDAATLGTTQIGVDPTGAEAVTALVTGIDTDGTEAIDAVANGANALAAYAVDENGAAVAGDVTTAVAETLTGANNAWNGAALAGGAAAGATPFVVIAHVVDAMEAALDRVMIPLPFSFYSAVVQRMTSVGAAATTPTITGVTGGFELSGVDLAAGDIITAIVVGA